MIWTVRHAVSIAGLEPRFGGHNASPLAREGLDQAGAIGSWLLDALRHNAANASWHIYTSPLRRAAQTAEVIGEVLGVDDIQVRADLVETDLGAWDGLTLEEVNSAWSQEFARWCKDDDAAPPGGESWTETARRAIRAFVAMDEEVSSPEATIAVSHSNPIKALLGAATHGREDFVVRDARLDFAGVSRFTYDQSTCDWRLHTWNEGPACRL